MKVYRAYTYKDENGYQEHVNINLPKKLNPNLSEVVIEIDNDGKKLRVVPDDFNSFNCEECALFHNDYDCSDLCHKIVMQYDVDEVHFEEIPMYEILFRG